MQLADDPPADDWEFTVVILTWKLLQFFVQNNSCPVQHGNDKKKTNNKQDSVDFK